MITGIYKSIVNSTCVDVEVELFIGSAQKHGSFGTRRLSIKAGEAQDVEIGDLQHGFLDGVSVTAEVNGTIIRQEQKVHGINCDFSKQLNSCCGLEIGDLLPPSLTAF